MPICQLIVDKNRMGAIIILETLLHGLQLVLGHLQAGPAVPLEAGGLAKTAQASDEAAGRHREVVGAIFGALDGDGKTVGEEEQAAGSGLAVLFDDAGHCVGGRTILAVRDAESSF